MLFEKILKIATILCGLLMLAYLVKQGDIFEALVMCFMGLIVVIAWIDEIKTAKRGKRVFKNN